MKILKLFIFSTLFALSVSLQAEDAIKSEMIVYRSQSCSCCGKWVEHAKQNQFDVKNVISDDMQAIKEKFAIPDKLASCHTAVVEGYVIEGHVPASDIQTLLKTRPNILGIAAPNMPIGSPGMEMGGHKDAFKVMSFDKDGKIAVFAEHEGN